jgi:FixJ family two-component response regulator
MKAASAPLIAIIDDEKSVRESLSSLLRSAGYRVELLASAEAYFQRGGAEKAACLILDVRMPGMSGLELQRHLLAAGDLTPIVFISANGNEEQRREALNCGAVDFLKKPFSDETLLHALRSALSGAVQDKSKINPGPNSAGRTSKD